MCMWQCVLLQCRELYLANCTTLNDVDLIRLTDSVQSLGLADEDAWISMGLEEPQHATIDGAGLDTDTASLGSVAGYPAQQPEPGRGTTARAFIEVGLLVTP